MLERLKLRRSLKYEEMNVFARFKYAQGKPALRVHVWDLFDNANFATKDFTSFFEEMYTQLKKMYEENGFDDETKELQIDEKSDNESEDSTNEQFVQAIADMTRFSIFNKDTEESVESSQETQQSN